MIHHSHVRCDDCGERHTPGNPAECIDVFRGRVSAAERERDEAMAAVDYEGAKAIAAQAQSVIDERDAELARLRAEVRELKASLEAVNFPPSVEMAVDCATARLRAELDAAKERIAALEADGKRLEIRLSRATHFAHGNAYVIRCEGHRLPKSPMWKVERRGFVLAKDGMWECEPLPSSRESEFYQRCRYDTYEDAAAAIDAAMEGRDG